MAKDQAGEPAGPERYRSLLPPEEFAALLEALKEPPRQGLRANTLKISIEEASSRWPRLYGWEMQPVPFCPAGWTLAPGGGRPGQTSEFKLGFYYLQDAASMLPAQLFSFKPGEKPLILDMAAAPGGKSTHLAALSGDRGLLVANDSSHGRIPALHSGLLDWGAINTLITNQPGEMFGRWFPEMFDKVLLDAPCSMDNLRGEGRRTTSDRERRGLAGRQAALLSNAVHALKPGGQVVYSTCTLAPEEDEGVLQAVLGMFPGRLRLDDVSREVGLQAPGLAGSGEGKYLDEIQKSLRLWPHLLGTGGFFAARLTKLDSSEGEGVDPPYLTFARLGFGELSRVEAAAAEKRIQEAYGFDLGPVLEGQELSLWRQGERVFTLAELYLRQFSSFPVQAPGFPIYEETRDGMILSHELTARFGRQFTRGIFIIDERDRTAWLRGSDLLGAGPGEEGLNSILLVKDEQGRLLGRGKVLRDRLKNMLPRRLAVG